MRSSSGLEEGKVVAQLGVGRMKQLAEETRWVKGQRGHGTGGDVYFLHVEKLHPRII